LFFVKLDVQMTKTLSRKHCFEGLLSHFGESAGAPAAKWHGWRRRAAVILATLSFLHAWIQ
jgi:hypothetical protein